jgi:hypothetical protein
MIEILLLLLQPFYSPFAPREVTKESPVAKRVAPSIEYEDVLKLAAWHKKPAVVFVGVRSRPIEGAYVYECDEFKPVKNGNATISQVILVARPNGKGWLDWSATLPAEATDSDIQRAIRGDLRRVSATPRAAAANC